MERINLFAIRQELNEKFYDYVIRLKKATNSCEFDTKESLDPGGEILIIALMAGINDLNLKKEID